MPVTVATPGLAKSIARSMTRSVFLNAAISETLSYSQGLQRAVPLFSICSRRLTTSMKRILGHCSGTTILRDRQTAEAMRHEYDYLPSREDNISHRINLLLSDETCRFLGGRW